MGLKEGDPSEANAVILLKQLRSRSVIRGEGEREGEVEVEPAAMVSGSTLSSSEEGGSGRVSKVGEDYGVVGVNHFHGSWKSAYDSHRNGRISSERSPAVQFFRDANGEIFGYKASEGRGTWHMEVFSPKRQKIFSPVTESLKSSHSNDGVESRSGRGRGSWRGRGVEKVRDWNSSPLPMAMAVESDISLVEEGEEERGGESETESEETGAIPERRTRFDVGFEAKGNVSHGIDKLQRVQTFSRGFGKEANFRSQKEFAGRGRIRDFDKLNININSKGEIVIPGARVAPRSDSSPYLSRSLSLPNVPPAGGFCFPFCASGAMSAMASEAPSESSPVGERDRKRVRGGEREWARRGPPFPAPILPPAPSTPPPPILPSHKASMTDPDLGDRPGIGSRQWSREGEGAAAGGGGEGAGGRGEREGGGRGGVQEGRRVEETAVDVFSSPRSSWLQTPPSGQRPARSKWAASNAMWERRIGSLSSRTTTTYASGESFRLGDFYTDGTDIEYLARLAKFFPFGSITLFLCLQSLGATSGTTSGRRDVTIASLGIGLAFAILLAFVKKVPLNNMTARWEWPYFFRLWKTSFALYIDGAVIAHAVVSCCAFAALTVFSDAARRDIAPNVQPATFLLLQHVLLLTCFILTLFIDDHVPSISTVCFGPLPSQRGMKSLGTLTPLSSSLDSSRPTNALSTKTRSLSPSISKLEVQRPSSFYVPTSQLTLSVPHAASYSSSFPSSTTDTSTVHDSEPGRKLRRLEVDERLDRGVLLASARRPILPQSPRSPASPPASRFRSIPSLLQRTFKESISLGTSQVQQNPHPQTLPNKGGGGGGGGGLFSSEESPESCTDSGPLGMSQETVRQAEQAEMRERERGEVSSKGVTDSEMSSEGVRKGRSSGRIPSSVEEGTDPTDEDSDPEVVDPKTEMGSVAT